MVPTDTDTDTDICMWINTDCSILYHSEVLKRIRLTDTLRVVLLWAEDRSIFARAACVFIIAFQAVINAAWKSVKRVNGWFKVKTKRPILPPLAEVKQMARSKPSLEMIQGIIYSYFGGNRITIWIQRYSGVMMSTIASQTTGISIVYSIVCSGVDQRKHQSSESRTSNTEMLPFDDVFVMISIYSFIYYMYIHSFVCCYYHYYHHYCGIMCGLG